jgi:predicted nucleotidyltransferase
MSGDNPLPAASDVARDLAAALEARGQEYALGGAIALGFWGEPRGTLDVDVTLFLAPDRPSECLWLLQDLECELTFSESLASLREYGFCRVTYHGLKLDVFLPIVDFYAAAQARRRRVQLAGQPVMIWDAESLIVLKFMFFRRKDIADVEGLLRVQQGRLDLDWVRHWLVELYGPRDPRVHQWEELVAEFKTQR